MLNVICKGAAVMQPIVTMNIPACCVLLQPVDEGLSFEEQIVGAAKSIAAATAALVKAASVAQRELVSQGKVGRDLRYILAVRCLQCFDAVGWVARSASDL